MKKMDSNLRMTFRELNHDLGRILEEESESDLWNVLNFNFKWKVEEILRVFERRSEEILALDPNLWGTLSVHILEKIITSLPLKDLIRLQVLSSAWSVRFHSRDFQADVDRVSYRWVSYYPLCLSKNSNSTQVMMGYDQTCHTWQKLFTLPHFTNNSGQQCLSWDFGGYVDNRSLKWTKMLSGVIGSLFVSNYFIGRVLHIFVTNPINKFVRRLPPLDFSDHETLMYHDWVDEKFIRPENRMCEVLPIDSSNAKIFVFSRDASLKVLQVRAYDSNFNCWTKPVCRSLPGSLLQHNSFRLVLDNIVLLGNVFYLSFRKSKAKDDDENESDDENEDEYEYCYNLHSYLQHVMVVYAYHTVEQEFKQIVLPISQDVPDVSIRSCTLAVSGTELLFIVQQGSQNQDEEQRQEWIAEDLENRKDHKKQLYVHWHPWAYIPKESFLLLKLDPKSLQLTEISRGPPKKLRSTTFARIICCDQYFISLKMKSEIQSENEALDFRLSDALARCQSGVLTFDMQQQVWSYVSPSDMLEHRRARPPKGVNVVSLEKSGSSYWFQTGLEDPTSWEWLDFSFQPGVNPFVTV